MKTNIRLHTLLPPIPEQVEGIQTNAQRVSATCSRLHIGDQMFSDSPFVSCLNDEVPCFASNDGQTRLPLKDVFTPELECAPKACRFKDC